MSVEIWLGGTGNMIKNLDLLKSLGMLVQKWLGGAGLKGLAGLIDRVEPAGTGQCGQIDV